MSWMRKLSAIFLKIVKGRAIMSEDLVGLELDDFYTVEKEIKYSKHEKTQLVRRDDDYYIRKYSYYKGSSKTFWALYSDTHSDYLPKLYNWYVVGDELAVVLEHVEGISLEAYVQKQGPLEEEEALGIALNIAEALDALHTQAALPLIHRDVNPSNIIVTPHKTSVLIDMGIARVFKEEQAHDTEILGTVGYAAPEQFGYQQSSPKSDIYSLAAVILFMLSGKRPNQHAVSELESYNLSMQLKSVLRRALDFNPEYRQTSAKIFKSELEGCLSPKTVPSYPLITNVPSPSVPKPQEQYVPKVVAWLKERPLAYKVYKSVQVVAFLVLVLFIFFYIGEVQKSLSIKPTILGISDASMTTFVAFFFFVAPLILLFNLFNIWSLPFLREHTVLKLFLGYIVFFFFAGIIQTILMSLAGTLIQ